MHIFVYTGLLLVVFICGINGQDYHPKQYLEILKKENEPPIPQAEEAEEDPDPNEDDDQLLTCVECQYRLDLNEVKCIADLDTQIQSLKQFKRMCFKQVTLKYLNIGRFVINGFNFSDINEQLIFDFEMKQLEYLDLSNNFIQNLNSTLNGPFQNLPKIKHLILDNNHLNLKTNYRALVNISSSLETLSLNNAFNYLLYETERERSKRLNLEIRELLFESKLGLNLVSLELRNNHLCEFNLNYTNSPSSLFLNQLYDILCLLPNLKRLYLNSNSIQTIDFNLDCIRNLEPSTFNLLNLEENTVQTLNETFIDKLKTLKETNSNFRIVLKNNRFKCNCNLYPFFVWLSSATESSTIVDEKDKLFCHSFNLPLLQVQMHKYCGHVFTANTTARTTTRVKSADNSSRKFTFNKLLIFVLIVVLLSMFLVYTLHYLRKTVIKTGRKQYRSTQLRTIFNDQDHHGESMATQTEPHITHVDNTDAYVATTTQVQSENDQIDLMDGRRQSRFLRFYRYLFTLSLIKRLNRKKAFLLTNNNLSGFDYRYFDDMNSTTINDGNNEELVMDREVFSKTRPILKLDTSHIEGGKNSNKYTVLRDLP